MSDELNFEDNHLFELFFADGETAEEDGLVWKDVLKEGTWSYRPGPGQKPIPVPLKIVSGHSETKEEIGMADILDAFEDGAVDHVTIPTSHDDNPQDNTGFVKELKITERDGKHYLRAGLEFTEPDIKEKAVRGSIANTSAGIIAEYIKKDSGKVYRNVLGHVSLTNKPWLNGMEPFGIAASEEYEDEDIVSLLSEDVVWDNNKSMSWIRQNLVKGFEDSEDNTSVVDIMSNRALIKQTSKSGIESNYVVPFQVRNNNVNIANQDRWISAKPEWVEMAETKDLDEKDFDGNDPLESVSLDADIAKPEGDNEMAKEKEESKTVEETPSNDPTPAQTELSEENRKEIADQIRSEFSEKYDGVAEENKKLNRQLHEMKVKERVEELKKLGFAEHPGLLEEIQKLMLADEGSTTLTLSEKVEGKDEPVKVDLSASDVIERLVDALPKKDGKVVLSEQALITDDKDKPLATPEINGDLSEDERAEAFAEELGIANFPKKEKETAKQGGDK